ncbi:MAG: DHA2 family efflux MFS transporter permease subunit [Chitinophagales bacterium]|nr:DHA2 family efflux MFS transporter permease subunit [Chitinophagales bacterium]
MSETGSRKWIVTITVILAALLELIDTTVVNVSLPQIMGNLGATLSEVGWVVTSYAIANVIIVPMTGWLSSKFGRKNYFTFSILLFTAASFFCGNANNIWELVAFRFIQGIGGGALLSSSQAILYETFPKEEMGLASAMFGMGIIIGPTIGPTLGGYITDHFSWPWVFYINLPLGIIAALLTVAYVREPEHKRDTSTIDWIGIGLLIVGIGSLQTLLERGQDEDWFSSRLIIVLTVCAAAGLIGFVWHELTTEHPVVDLRVLRNRSLALGTIFTFILGFGLFSTVFIIPIFTQNLLGFTAQQTGLLLLPGSLFSGFMMPFVGTALKKGMRPQILSAGGFILFFVFVYWMSGFNADVGQGNFVIPLIIRGAGLGLLFVPITTMALSGLAPKDIPQGTGLTNMMRQLGGSFGIALVGTFLQHRVAFHRADLVSYINDYSISFQNRISSYQQNFIAKGYSISDAQQLAYRAIDGAITKQAFLLSYLDIFLAIGVFFLCCIPLLFFVRLKKSAQPIMGGH